MMTRRTLVLAAAAAIALAALPRPSATAEASVATEALAAPEIHSMSALAFTPDGVLLVGDGKGGAVFAIALDDQPRTTWQGRFSLPDVEAKIAARLGTSADEILIHDLAVNPKTERVYLAVSRGRGGWTDPWLLPNDLDDATVLLTIDGDSEIREVDLGAATWTRSELPNPVGVDRAHRWKDGISLRADTITDMAFAEDILYVAGLSNEEFASTLWKMSYPFEPGVGATTLEIFHGAHGAYETHAPIRTFVPYELDGEDHLLAAYLCTPFVTFRAAELEAGKHVKGRTIAEFGSGNYPLDMVAYRKGDSQRLLIANSNLPLMILKAEDIEAFEGEIVEAPATYAAGLTYETRSGSGIQQLALLNEDQFVALQRRPSGTMDLVTLAVARF